MAMQVVAGATMMCAFGVTPSTLKVIPANRPLVRGFAAANILDNKPMLNIAPFGACRSPANPAVTAGGGAPVPCVPVTSPWTPGSPKEVVAGSAALNSDSMCICKWTGVIKIATPG